MAGIIVKWCTMSTKSKCILVCICTLFSHFLIWQEILPACLRYCELVVQREENEAPILHFLCDLCLHFEPQSADSLAMSTSCSTSQHFIISLEQVSLRVVKRSKGRRTAAESHIVAALRKHLDTELHRLKQKPLGYVDKSTGHFDVGKGCNEFHCLWALLVCLQHIRYM